MSLLQSLARDDGGMILLVTHDHRILDVADRIANLVDGRLVSDVAVQESVGICELLTQCPVFAGLTPAALSDIAEKMSLGSCSRRRHQGRQPGPHRQRGSRAMKVLEIDEATHPLAHYTRRVRREPLVVTDAGKPVAALVALENSDLESVVLSTDPRFIALIERSRARHKSEGGIPSAEMRRRLRSRPAPSRDPQPNRRAPRRA